MTERCGFWQGYHCGREICLEVCRPATPLQPWQYDQCPDSAGRAMLKEQWEQSRQLGVYRALIATNQPSGEEALTILFHGALKGLPYAAVSWNGFNLFGDEASIKEVSRALHVAGNAPLLRNEINLLREQIATLSATKGTPAQPEPPEAGSNPDFDAGFERGFLQGQQSVAANPALEKAHDLVLKWAAALATQPAPVDERAVFEAWAQTIGFGPTAFAMKQADGRYGAMFLESRWEGWKARAALAAPKPGEAK